MISSCELILTPAGVDGRVGGAACVAIDVFRATSVMVTALANGAAGTLAVPTPEAGFAAAERLGRAHVVLGGERNSVKIPGYDAGNSPGEYGGERVAGKTVVMTTTNGTKAIVAIEAATRETPAVYLGALLNASAVARALDASAFERAVLVCGGQDGEVSLEDIVGAGAIAQSLGAYAVGGVACGDEVRAAVKLYQAYRSDTYALLRDGRHAQHLIELGFDADLRACTQVDSLPVAPRLKGDTFRI